MAPPLEPFTLTGRHVQLEPLSLDHVDDLVAAASVDRRTYGLTWVPTDQDSMTAHVEGLLADHAAGRVLPFAQRTVTDGEPGPIVGCTRYLDIHYWRGRAAPDEVEIGGTWLSSSVQRTGVNTNAKLLLLTHAFESWDVWRVALCTDARNQRSRDAIERIGARFEGVLRNHRLRSDTPAPSPRDTAIFAMTADDWPDVRSRLTAIVESGS